MNYIKVMAFVIGLFIVSSINAQNIIDFENLGWNANQSVDTTFLADNVIFSGNKELFTNYGYNFDVNNISLYYAFQDPLTDQITIKTPENEFVDLISLAVYQVSEIGTDTLLFEGWADANKKYISKFAKNDSWKILSLNFKNINKLIIRSANTTYPGLIDYNIDNIIYDVPSAPIDTIPPELLNAKLLNSSTLLLNFSEELEINSAINRSNYNINNNITIESAEIQNEKSKVILHTTEHIYKNSYNISLKNISDTSGNILNESVTLQYFNDIDNIPPQFIDLTVVNNKSLNLKFSEKLDPASTQNQSNFKLSDGASINKATLSPDSTSIIIETSPQKKGAEYTLSVSNIKDLSDNIINPVTQQKDYTLPSLRKNPATKHSAINAASGSWYQNMSPDKSIDGVGMSDTTSRWVSNRLMPDTIQYDMGEIYSFDSIRTSFCGWESGRKYKYSIYSSNDLNEWIPVIEEVWSDSAEWSEILLNTIDTRFIKLVLLKSNSNDPAGIWEIEFYGSEQITDNGNADNMLNEYYLSQNYPNPFNPSTIIEYQIRKESNVSLKIYDLLGNEVATLVSKRQSAGKYNVRFNAENLSSGLYIYSLRTDNFSSTKKMILIK